MCGFQAVMSVAGMMMNMAQTKAQQASQDAQLRAQEEAAAIRRTQEADEAAYNAQISQNNAAIQRNEAEGEKSAAFLEGARAKLKASQKAGSQEAAMGASGALATGGTNALIVEGTMQDAELDALMIRTSGENKASAYEAAAKNYESQRDMDLWKGSDYGRRAEPTLLTQSSPVSSRWDPLRQTA